jgi:hypothetical protein
MIDAANRDSCYRIAPIAVRGVDAADAVDAGVDVHKSLAAARRATSARPTTPQKCRHWSE